MLNFKYHILGLFPATPNFFYDFVSGKGPSCVVKFWQELIGAFVGDFDALKWNKLQKKTFIKLRFKTRAGKSLSNGSSFLVKSNFS